MDSAFPGPLWAERAPVRFIHRGSWSDTVEARTVSGEVSAIKVAEAGGDLAEAVAGWAEAARAVSRAVEHPAVLTHRSVDVVDGWLSAERRYVEGVDLATLAATRAETAVECPIELVAAITLGLVEAAAALHHVGLVAGRISPSHVLLSRDGTVHLLGAGTPEVTGHADRERATEVDREVAFAPPERFAGGARDARTDVFGIASVACLLSAGRPVIPAEHRLARVLARRGAEVIGPSASAPIPDPTLAAIITAALAADPAARPPLPALAAALAARAAPRDEVSGFVRSVVGEAALRHGRE